MSIVAQHECTKQGGHRSVKSAQDSRFPDRSIAASSGTLSFFAMATAISSVAATQPSSALWYRQPAARWEQALPIGNGRLGAMVFGGAGEERLQLNENSIWAGTRLPVPVAKGPEIISRARQLFF